jgi:hypothetical protein
LAVVQAEAEAMLGMKGFRAMFLEESSGSSAEAYIAMEALDGLRTVQGVQKCLGAVVVSLPGQGRVVLGVMKELCPLGNLEYVAR